MPNLHNPTQHSPSPVTTDKPRERMLASGTAVLSDAELMAVLLRSGTPGEPALQVSRRLLDLFRNDLAELARADWRRLASVDGIGPVKALSVLAALELGRRCRLQEVRQKQKITTSADAAALLDPLLRDLGHEEFWIILLNRANCLLDLRPISKGGISGTVVDPKLVFHEAVQHKASAVILGHNHPSGTARPSDSDKQLTQKLKEVGKALEMPVLDHIIIAGSRFYSFADEGLL
ncbi:MAG: DNA repair protein RadC [Bacteroidota bacterium]